MFVIDLTVFLLFIVLAIKSNRYWPSCAAGIKLLAVSAHPLKYFYESAIYYRTYGILDEVWSYLYMIVIVIGTFRHLRRISTYGCDPDWVTR